MDKPSDENGAFRSPPGEQSAIEWGYRPIQCISRLPVICQRRDAMPRLPQIRITDAGLALAALAGATAESTIDQIQSFWY